MHLSIEDAFVQHYEAEAERRTKMDCREGPLAFVEKRKPIWGLGKEDWRHRGVVEYPKSEG